MAKKKLVFTQEHDQLKSLIDEAQWVLTDTDIAKIMPGASEDAISQLDRLINTKEVINHPFSKTRIGSDYLDRPDLTLLKVLSDPEYFAFACYHLFSINGVDPLRLESFQQVVLQEFWWRQLPLLACTRGFSKSFLLGLYIILRLTFQPGSQIAVVAKSLRQSMLIWEYCCRIWNNSPVFRDLVGTGDSTIENGPRRGGNDRCEFRIGDSIALFLPLGATGETIRGVRAQIVIADECASISEDVYAVVVQGFGAVSMDPVAKASRSRREKILKRLCMWSDEMEAEAFISKTGNQSILSGTASYHFNHFARYWKDYHDVLMTKGDKNKLNDLFPEGIPKGFDWRRYSIMRIPWELIPHGYMDEATISRAQQISSTANFAMEYGAVFINDSDGFFKRSVLEKASIGATPGPLPHFASCGDVDFSVSLYGDKSKRYVYGVDPALQKDNFAIVIIEVHPDHRRVVYCWTTNKKDHRERRKRSGASPDFYKFVVRKLRELFRRFPPAEVLIDAGSGGGGNTLVEAFSDPDKLEEGERAIYEVIEDDVKKDTDWMDGDHIIRQIQFSKHSWVVDANWGLRKDLEGRVLLFPRINEISFGLAYEEDIESGRLVERENTVETLEDSLESALFEIEELKDELTQIVIVPTPTGQDRWDTPENVAAQGGKRGPLKKDRYSALLMANAGARVLNSGSISVPQICAGVVAGTSRERSNTGFRFGVSSPRLIKVFGNMGTGCIARK